MKKKFISLSLIIFSLFHVYSFEEGTFSKWTKEKLKNEDADFFDTEQTAIYKSFRHVEITFCIINQKRGILLKAPDENQKEYYSFFSWSPIKHQYILDKSMKSDQIKNAYYPKDFFAYNGLKFSKLDSKLTDEDLRDLDQSQLRVLRNAVYARHGRTFKSLDLQSLWECYTWYKKNPSYSDSLLTKTDKYNIGLIQKYEIK